MEFFKLELLVNVSTCSLAEKVGYDGNREKSEELLVQASARLKESTNGSARASSCGGDLDRLVCDKSRPR